MFLYALIHVIWQQFPKKKKTFKIGYRCQVLVIFDTSSYMSSISFILSSSNLFIFITIQVVVIHFIFKNVKLKLTMQHPSHTSRRTINIIFFWLSLFYNLKLQFFKGNFWSRLSKDGSCPIPTIVVWVLSYRSKQFSYAIQCVCA